MFWIILIILIGFAIYLYFQTKIKSAYNYPIVYAILIGFLVFTSSSYMPQWIIDNLNKYFPTLNLSPYKPLGLTEMIVFLAFLLIALLIFYQTKESSVEQKNSFFFSY